MGVFYFYEYYGFFDKTKYLLLNQENKHLRWDKLDSNEWINKNYQRMLDVVKNIVTNQDDIDDLYHCVLEQILKGKKFDGIDDDQRIFYFVRVLKNNYFSKTSPYYYQYKKNPAKEDFKDITYFDTKADEEYIQNLPDIHWIHEQLTHLNWFDRDLFLMWLEMGSLTAVSKQTTIPLNSVGRYIKTTKEILKNKWESKN